VAATIITGNMLGLTPGGLAPNIRGVDVEDGVSVTGLAEQPRATERHFRQRGSRDPPLGCGRHGSHRQSIGTAVNGLDDAGNVGFGIEITAGRSTRRLAEACGCEHHRLQRWRRRIDNGSTRNRVIANRLFQMTASGIDIAGDGITPTTRRPGFVPTHAELPGAGIRPRFNVTGNVIILGRTGRSRA
jgi:hypothetical protein